MGDLPPNDQQKHLYQVAYDHVMTNMELLKPGMSFSEVTAKSHRLPAAFSPLRYSVLAHGIGLCDEYPSIRYPEDAKNHSYNGCLEQGMTLCVEAYVGAEGGHEGVKPDEQIVITAAEVEPLSSYPYGTALMA